MKADSRQIIRPNGETVENALLLNLGRAVYEYLGSLGADASGNSRVLTAEGSAFTTRDCSESKFGKGAVFDTTRDFTRVDAGLNLYQDFSIALVFDYDTDPIAPTALQDRYLHLCTYGHQSDWAFAIFVHRTNGNPTPRLGLAHTHSGNSIATGLGVINVGLNTLTVRRKISTRTYSCKLNGVLLSDVVWGSGNNPKSDSAGPFHLGGYLDSPGDAGTVSDRRFSGACFSAHIFPELRDQEELDAIVDAEGTDTFTDETAGYTFETLSRQLGAYEVYVDLVSNGSGVFTFDAATAGAGTILHASPVSINAASSVAVITSVSGLVLSGKTVQASDGAVIASCPVRLKLVLK